MTLTVTVLIPAHNEEKTIVHVLDQLKKQDFPIEEIFVVADACTDNTAELARMYGATRVWETDLKDKAGAQNIALPHVTSDVVVGFDGDSWPADERTVGLMINDLVKHDLDATCGTILPAQQYGWPFEGTRLVKRIEGHIFTGSRNFAYALGRRWWRLCQAKVGRIQVLTGACYAFRTEAIKDIGGFPNGLITADMDATWRLHAEGYKLGYTGDSVTYTLDPEDFKTYRNQMRRWSSGYYQNMAKHRRQLANWRSALVVGGAIIDLVLLFAYTVFLAYSLVTWSNLRFLQSVALWMGAHVVVTIGLVWSVVGWRKALSGVVPYMLVNYYNKWLYFTGFVREWILGRHYAAWTGRQGRRVEITPMTKARRLTLSLIMLGTAAASLSTATFVKPVMSEVAGLLLLMGSLALYPWRGGGRHGAPKKGKKALEPVPPRLMLPAPRHEETMPLRVLPLLNPYAETTTELEIPKGMRNGPTS